MELDLTRELHLLEELVVNFILSENAKKQYSMGKVSKRELETYTEQLKSISGQYLGISGVKLNRQQVAAYTLYYLPINFAKLAYLISREISFSLKQPIRILDFGCGPGTAALAAAACLDQQLEISLYDASSECTDMASQLLKSYRPKVRSKITHSLVKLEKNTFDLVIAANVLTELSPLERATQLDQLIRLVDKNGYLILLEPALKTCTQNLMRDRDSILANHSELSVIFPCFTQNPCPMLKEDKNDWCHGQLPQHSWERPTLLKQLDQLLGFNKHRIKYAGFIFQCSQKAQPNSLRILRPISKSHPALLCGKDGLIKMAAREVKDSKARRLLKANETFGVLEDLVTSEAV